MKNETVTELKAAQRKLGIKSRVSLTPDERALFSEIICEKLINHHVFKQSQIILSYQAFMDEVDLSKFNIFAKSENKTVAYPTCQPGGIMLAAVPASGEDIWKIDKYGIRSPLISRSHILAQEEIEFIVAPCVAFSGVSLSRMGWGAGYYDRFLPKCVNAFRVAAAFEAQKIDDLVCVPNWDVSLNAIVTEKAWY
ncbi:MAG: 5-formyltetrahydrofolate cyclo-ligase [Clostridiales bacterium]|jgi:5-formyltetrahydrofolate cyclo-ligase|nr:5-formyltetrahydrofolate cyclo-ligase [Clostridiales bacterium]